MTTERYEIDPSHTTIGFSARHLAVSTVRGHFTKFSGGVELIDGNPLSAKGEASIEINSIHTGSEQRDGHLKSGDFFDSEKYPTIRYSVTSVELVDGETYRVTGDLTIKDVTKPVVLEASVDARIPDPFGGKERVGLTVTGKINRMDFGLNWDGIAGAVPLASHTIKLEVDLAVVSPATETATA